MRASPLFVTFSWHAQTSIEACHELRVWNILPLFMNITPQELKSRLDAGKKIRLIDVREQDESSSIATTACAPARRRVS
jgi:hypothetical protein